MQDSSSNSAYAVRKPFFRRRKTCPLSEEGAPEIDHKNIPLLLKFVSERGRILPSRITSVSAIKQRKLKRAIKVARSLALLPFVKK
ncbi:MAG: 30S ribosomal protein S18 [Alphaproteobacteria bacterium]|nr:30S ribosomal protein S18 [Alphaproteobacteria bacterium]OJV16260.1 MAG: 30S ribosomal protein S18 [Alphaproteobacteria bacterium 33-17]